MGLFSSKYVTRVSASVTRAVSDAQLPDAVKTGTLKALLRDGDQGDHILEELVSGLALKANRMYRYGETGYTNGLPSGEIVTSNQGQAALQAVLDTLEGATVVMDYNHYGPPNNLHTAWMRLVSSHGYNPDTNQLGVLTAAQGTPVFLHDMVIQVPGDTKAQMAFGSLAQWGAAPRSGVSPSRPAWNDEYKWIITHNPIDTFPGSGTSYAVAYWVKAVAGSTFGLYTSSVPVAFTVALTGLDEAADYFHAKYKVGGVTKYFMYKVGTGTYPTLDTFYDADPELLGEFFPIAHFRYSKVSIASNTTTAEYRTTKKLVKYLGLDFDQVSTAIDNNPDIADIEQAMLMLAVPAITTVELEQRYLYEFFKRMYLTSPETFTSNAMRLLTTPLGSNKTTMVIQDHRFKFSLVNSGIIRQMVSGTLGPVGSYHSTTGFTPVPYSVMVGGGPEAERVETTEYTNVYHFSYRKQVTSFAYEEIRVVDLSLTYHMDSVYHVVGDEADNLLLIPLDSVLTRTFSLPDREALYARSMHFVFTSRIVTKVRWYQQAFFMDLLKIVGVVLAVVTGGASLQAFLIGVTTGAIGLTTAIMTLLTTLLEYLVTSTLIQLFVKAVGGDAAIIFALVLVVAAGVDAIRSGSIKGAPWAQDLLKLASSLTKGVSEFVKDGFMELQKEALAFTDYMKDANDDLTVARRLLASSNRLDPLVLWGESPDQYYKRTVHSGNIGLLSISAVSSYVTNSLKLPELSQTLGEDY